MKPEQALMLILMAVVFVILVAIAISSMSAFVNGG